MIVVKTILKEVPGKGIGLFADQDIAAGQAVWQYEPVIDILVKKADVPAGAKEFFRVYGVDTGEDFMMLNTDNARFINHSDRPNLRSLGPFEANIASRDIRAGEELTIDYTEIDAVGVDFESLPD